MTVAQGAGGGGGESQLWEGGGAIIKGRGAIRKGRAAPAVGTEQDYFYKKKPRSLATKEREAKQKLRRQARTFPSLFLARCVG